MGHPGWKIKSPKLITGAHKEGIPNAGGESKPKMSKLVL